MSNLDGDSRRAAQPATIAGCSNRMFPTELGTIPRDSVASTKRMPKATTGLEGESHATAAAPPIASRTRAALPIRLSPVSHRAMATGTDSATIAATWPRLHPLSMSLAPLSLPSPPPRRSRHAPQLGSRRSV